MMGSSVRHDSGGGNRRLARNPGLSDVRLQILNVLQRDEEFDLEELVRLCPSYTWNQVFLEVDRLSRTGALRLRPKRPGVYAVTRSTHQPGGLLTGGPTHLQT